MRFIDLDVAAITGATIFLDIDGTLVADSSDTVGAAARAVVEALREQNDVYLASNGATTARTAQLAQALGVHALPRLHKPFVSTAVRAVVQRDRVVVIGDKLITDGWFAYALGAEFIQVESVRSTTEDVIARTAYALEYAVSWAAPFVLLARPQQYVKNVLVFAPLFFAEAFFLPQKFVATLAAFVAFSLAASTVYVINDLFDRAQDRLHPSKKRRPLASGAVTARGAYGFIGVLLVLECLLWLWHPAIAPILALYLITNVLYSAVLKNIVVVDVVVVASFYLMRIVAGGSAAQIPLSRWIFVCVFFGALFLVTGKRLAELRHGTRRKVFLKYSEPALRALFFAAGAFAVVSYGFYSVRGHSSSYLLYSTILPAFVFLRVFNRVRTHPEEAESPERILFRDRWVFIAFVLWAALLFGVFYLGR